MNHILPSLFFSGREKLLPVEQIPVVLIEGKGFFQSAFEQQWIEAADFRAADAHHWGAYHELVPRIDPRIDAPGETTETRMGIVCQVRGNTDALRYQLVVRISAQEPLLFGRKLEGEKLFPISVGVPSYREKVVAFLQARAYAFAWLRSYRAHLHHLFPHSDPGRTLALSSALASRTNRNASSSTASSHDGRVCSVLSLGGAASGCWSAHSTDSNYLNGS